MAARAGLLAGVLVFGPVAFGVLGGCERTHYGRMAMRGAPYKRLIPSVAELGEIREGLRERLPAETDPERVERGEALLAKVEATHEEFTTGLELWRREKWHRVRMGALWREYRGLYPEERATQRAYKGQRRVDWNEIQDRRTPLTGEMRFSPTFKTPRRDVDPEDQGLWGPESLAWRSEMPRPATGGWTTPEVHPVYREDEVGGGLILVSPGSPARVVGGGVVPGAEHEGVWDVPVATPSTGGSVLIESLPVE
jgi:hypothetical protein